VRRGLEQIPTVRDALASHDLLPVSLQKPVSLSHNARL
jgi:hypothetical protein